MRRKKWTSKKQGERGKDEKTRVNACMECLCVYVLRVCLCELDKREEERAWMPGHGPA